MTKQEVKAMIEDADCNGDNKLDYHEVSAIIAKVFEGYMIYLGVNVLRSTMLFSAAHNRCCLLICCFLSKKSVFFLIICFNFFRLYFSC